MAIQIILFALACFAASLGLCAVIYKILLKKQLLDTPNERSMHSVPVPRGGGLALWLALFPLWIGYLAFSGAAMQKLPLLAGAVLLFFVSWADDKKSLPAAFRFGAHILAVCLGLYGFNENQLFFQGLFPFWLDRFAAGFAWVWFINLMNFMDGIDGITSSNAITTSLGIILLGTFIPLVPENIMLAAGLIGVCAGFLKWNWHPAKMFMGDVGSVPLGFFVGYLLLTLAAQGYLLMALALPLSYVADATLTLLKRIFRREKFWQPHRQHFYQRAALAAGRHAPVVIAFILANCGLIFISLIALNITPYALLAAPLLVAALLWYLERLSKSGKTETT